MVRLPLSRCCTELLATKLVRASIRKNLDVVIEIHRNHVRRSCSDVSLFLSNSNHPQEYLLVERLEAV